MQLCEQWINKCSLPDGMYRAWRLWQSIGCKTFQIEYTVTLVSFTVVHQKERWGFKTDLTLWRRTCSLSGTVFTIFYRGWQEHGWWKCQHWLLLSVKHMALAWQSSLERHCCTEMWRKVKRSAALPNNPRHNMVWMTAAQKSKSRRFARQDNIQCVWLQTSKVLVYVTSRKKTQYF